MERNPSPHVPENSDRPDYRDGHHARAGEQLDLPTVGASKEDEPGDIPTQSTRPESARDDSTAALLLPDETDYSIRPDSSSERFTEPDVEVSLIRAMLYGKDNFPAILGVVLAVLGILANPWGTVLAGLGLVFSVAGVWAGAHGAKRLWLAVAGGLIALMHLASAIL